MTDLERFQAKANSITDSSLESTRRMMSMVNEVICYNVPNRGLRGMFLEPSHGGEHPGHAQHSGGADQQDREQPRHHQRRDEGG